MQGPVRDLNLSPQTVEQRLAALEGRLLSLEKLVAIATDGTLTIKGTTKISLQAPTVEVKTAVSFLVNSAANVEVKASSQLALSAGGAAAVKAATLSLNGGSKALARVGDLITGNVIAAGSPNTFG